MGWLDPISDISKLAGKALHAGENLAEDGAKGFAGAMKDAAKAVTKMSPSEIGHTALNVAGMIPVIGAPADAINAGWYAAQGDWGNAALSAATAIPGLGDVVGGARLGATALKIGEDGVEIAKDGVEAERAVKGGEAAIEGTEAATKGTEAATKEATKGTEVGSAKEASKPTEPYNRQTHYGKSPSAADRQAVGAGPGEVADHEPPLVQRYYEGDPSTGEKPGYMMTDKERKASAGDRSRMTPQPRADSDRQGGEMSAYSRQKKKEHGL
jgi:hypothetical protein